MNTITPPAALRSLTALLTVGLFAAGLAAPARADTPAPAASGLPTALVNGDFEYPGNDVLGMRHNQVVNSIYTDWSVVIPGKRIVWNYQGDRTPAGFDPGRFGWASDQTIDKGFGEERPHTVELQYDLSGNIYAEIVGKQENTSIYQDIDTSGGPAMYTVSLKHASQSKRYLDKMQVLVGAPGHETPVEMTRVTSNGNGDKVGETGDIIATRVSNDAEANGGTDLSYTSRNHEGQWETYQGTVLVPAGQDVTRFRFRNVDAKTSNMGNIVDDIIFTKAYPLAYDGNGGQGALPQQSN